MLVHDAARPLIEPSIIQACINALDTHVGAVVSMPSYATVKRTADGLTVSETVPRDPLWLAQTPQGLHRHEALTAFAAADQTGDRHPDDVAVPEQAGHRISPGPGVDT